MAIILWQKREADISYVPNTMQSCSRSVADFEIFCLFLGKRGRNKFDKNFCPHIGGCGKSGRNLIAFPATHEGGPPHPDGHQISADHW